MTDERQPLNIVYETEHCLVRELELSDDCEALSRWMADPETAKALNAPVQTLSMEDVRKYVLSHNRIDGHLLGVFDKSNQKLIGIWSVYIDWKFREFLINVLIAEHVNSDVGTLRETGRPLYRLMFVNLDLESMCFNVIASNTNMQTRLTRAPDHTSNVPSASGEGTETVNHYRLTKQRYLELYANRAQRDAEVIAKRNARQQSAA